VAETELSAVWQTITRSYRRRRSLWNLKTAPLVASPDLSRREDQDWEIRCTEGTAFKNSSYFLLNCSPPSACRLRTGFRLGGECIYNVSAGWALQPQ
jgi:hypothetical protein